MAHRIAAALLVAAATTPAQACEDRLAASWPFMIEGCLAYLETGRRAVFEGWHVAFPGGGVCNGDPSCEGPDMTFIGKRDMGMGAVTVLVPGEGPVGDRPEAADCLAAAGTRHTPDAVGPTHDAWVERALASGRLEADAAGGLLGCAWDGRRYSLRFTFAPPHVASFRARLPAGGTCLGAVS
jgi:hypothetical protein